MLGSFSVQTRPITSPRWAAARAAKRAKRSAVSGLASRRGPRASGAW